MKGVIFMSRKPVYPIEIRIKVGRAYAEGKMTARELVEKFCISSKGDVMKWGALYKKHGEEGFRVQRSSYSGDFKLTVIEYMHNTNASLSQTAAHFNIPSRESIRKWERIYYEEGKEALYEERRGRASKMGTKRPRKSKKNLETNEDLLAEVQRLRMENEYLKKLNALVQEREKSKKPTK